MTTPKNVYLKTPQNEDKRNNQVLASGIRSFLFGSVFQRPQATLTHIQQHLRLQKVWISKKKMGSWRSILPTRHLCWMISLYFWRSRWYFGRPSPCLTIWTTGFGTKSKSKSEKSRKSRSWRHDQTHSIAQLWEFLIFLRTSRKTTWKTTGWQCAVRFTQFLGQLLRIWRTSVSAGKKPERDLQRLTQIWSFPKIFRTKTHSSHTININQPLQERSSPFQNQTPKNIGFVVSKSTNHQQLNYSNIQWDHGQLDITEDEKGPWTIPDASL